MASQLSSRSSSYETALKRSRLRRILLETLDRRELLAADAAAPVFAQGTSQQYMDDVIAQFAAGAVAAGEDSGQFNLQGTRWTNPTGGPSLNQGDAATVTWSIVPDGTIDGANNAASDLISFMDNIYTPAGQRTGPVNQRPWFNIFQRAYDRWSELSGVTFVYEPADDGVNMGGGNRGVAGVRGDVRIGGRNIDGNFGTLAFNYFPNNGGNGGFDGDMIIDTNDVFFFNAADGPTGENRGLSNLLMHEAGHGIGLGHTIPVDNTKLMEPSITFAFLGPQHDDILGAHALYGDPRENDDVLANATDLGELSNGNTRLSGGSIDFAFDDDWFTFSVPSAGRVSVTLEPLGEQYSVGPMGGVITPENSLDNQDLQLEVLAADGTTVLAQVNATGRGEAEQLDDLDLPAGGTYHLRIIGDGSEDDEPQLYDLNMRLTGLSGPNVVVQPPRLLSVSPNVGEIFSFNRTNALDLGPNELVFRFDGAQFLDAASFDGIRITRAGHDGSFDDGNEVVLTPGFIGFGDSERVIIARFAETLLDDLYRIEVFGVDDPTLGVTAVRNISGDALRPRINGTDRDTLFFDLELGNFIEAVVPQPTSRNLAGEIVQARNQIEVYFSEGDRLHPVDVTTGDLAPNPTVVDPSFYQLHADRGTVSNTDDATYTPVGVEYFADRNMALLTFSSNIETLDINLDTSYRLRIGTNETRPSVPLVAAQPTDPGSTFDVTGAADLGVLNSISSLEVTEQILNSSVFPLDFPGAPDTPGSREVFNDPGLGESHFLNDSPDANVGIVTQFYNFNKVDPVTTDNNGQPLFNSISPAQEQRAREIFELFGSLLGISFIETENQGWTIATASIDGPSGVLGRAGGVVGGGGSAIMDAAESWNDEFGASDDPSKFSWFGVAMHEIGHLLGLGHSTELPPGSIMGGLYSNITLGGEPALLSGNPVEPVFPGPADTTNAKYLLRPDSRDIDMYRFEVAPGSAGEFTAEIVAERLQNSSLLDSVLTLFRELPDGSREVIGVNDDYFSEDSFMRLHLEPGTYFIGVSASGNTDYNPEIEDSGLGGVTEGQYRLRTTFRPSEANSIVDEDGAALDGDADGAAGGVFNFWFNAAAPNGENAGGRRTLFVDKVSGAGGDGSRATPYNTISDAFAAAQPGDIVRLVANGGADGDVATQADNLGFEVGTGGLGNQPLQDGASMNVPKGVTVMIDAGVLMKMGRSVIGVGSSTSSGDRSEANLQVLGTPEQQVFFTSYTDETLGEDTDPLTTTAQAGDWGGIIFRNALDRAEGRFDSELEGRFVNYVGHANMRYGGGQVPVDGQNTVITPLHMVTARPTLINNQITDSAFAAISADPNSFEETTFTAPRFQANALFTPDYDRVGPEINGNTVVDNSLNGLFVRVETPAGQNTAAQTVSGRWNDTDIVHIVADTLTIAGTPGGPIRESSPPELDVVLIGDGGNVPGGQLVPGVAYSYRMTFVDANGSEGAPSDPTQQFVLGGGSNAIELRNLPPAAGDFVARKIYRSANGGVFELVAELDRSSTVYVDSASPSGAVLAPFTQLNRARLDANLVIDPGMLVKLQGGRIVTGVSAQLVAEGREGLPVIFTSRQDDSYGAGGTFDTNGDAATSAPLRGDWGGIYFGHAGSGSLDHALVTYAGGVTGVGGTFAGFNAVEIHQADVRIANSTLENNASGVGGAATENRNGAGFNEPAAIFVRGAQPIIVDNIIRDNEDAAISIDPMSLNGESVKDKGRVTGFADRRASITENKGPLLRGNALGDNGVNAMVIRGATLSSESVWDDTDTVHAMFDQILIPDLYVFGGLRLQSSPNESLVVKFGPGAGLTSNGRPLDIDDRIGGTLQVVGTPGFPVVLTSIADDSTGAGFGPDGVANTDTNGDGSNSLPSPGDWDGLLIDEFSNDRNVAILTELEPAQSTGAGVNGVPTSAQFLGQLATGEKASDDNLRLGFNVHSTINNIDDVDVYSFTGAAGSEVWLDIDRTNISLDAVVELVDSDGNIIAQSDSSLSESNGSLGIFSDPSKIDVRHVNPLQNDPFGPRNFGSGSPSLTNSFADFYSTNPRDPGMRLILPGASGSVNTYFVRVRSSNIDSLDPGANRADLQDPSKLADGKTEGQYQLQIRLRAMDEFAGSSVSFADVRYASIGIQVLGGIAHSPLVGEAVELEGNNNTVATALDLGNLTNTDRAALSIAGDLNDPLDVDWYRFDVNQGSLQDSGLVQHLSTMIDVDYADGLGRANTSLWLYYQDQNGIGSGNNNGLRLVNFGTDSNIADDLAAPTEGSDTDDLSRGTGGILDAFIGSSALPSGTYFLAITSNEQVSSYLQQFYAANAGGHQLARVEPINSVTRLIEDRFGGAITTAGAPLQVGFTGNTNHVPYTLADIPLLITQRAPGNDTSELITVSAFTGQQTSLVSRFPFVEDAAIRGDGTVHGARSQQTGVINDGNSGGILQIDAAGDGATNAITAASGIQTFELDFTQAPPGVANALTPGNGQRQGVGIEFLGLTYPQEGNTQFLYGVGSRGYGQTSFASFAGQTDARNYVYKLDPTSLAAVSTPQQDRTNNGRVGGAGTQIRERGYIDTSIDAGFIRNATAQTISMSDATPSNGEPALLSGDTVTIQTPNGTTTFEWIADILSATPAADTEPQTEADVLGLTPPTNFFRDTQNFTLSSTTDTATFEVDTGRVIVNNYSIPANPPLWDGSTFEIRDNNGNRVVFEFDSTNQVTAPNVPVTYDSANTTPFQMSQILVNTINNPPAVSVLDAEGNPSTIGWSAQAFLLPGTNRISLINDHSVSLINNGVPNPLTVTSLINQFPNGPSNTYDGATFTITDLTGDALTFEFDLDNNVTAGNVPISFTASSNQQFLTQAVNAAINNVPAPILAGLGGTWDVTSIFSFGSNSLRLLGDAFVSIAPSNGPVTNPMGLSPEYGLQGDAENDNGAVLTTDNFDPLATLNTLPSSLDGATFTVEDINGNTVVFEFDHTLAAPGVSSTAGVPHMPVSYDPLVDTPVTLSQRIAVAVSNPLLGTVNPAAQPWAAAAHWDASTNELRIIGETSVTVNAPQQRFVLDNLFPPLAAGQTYDGATFTIEGPVGVFTTYELEDVTVADGTAAGNTVVAYDPGLPTNVLTQDITTIINAVNIGGVTAQQPLGTEQVWLTNAINVFTTPPFGDELLTLLNNFPTLNNDETYDGVRIQITDLSGDVITFELEDIQVGNGVAAGNSAVFFDSALTQTDLTQALVDGINGPDGFVLGGLAGAWEAFATTPAGQEEVHVGGVTAIVVDPLPGNTILRFLNDFQALNPGESFDGATFTITDANGETITFELEDTAVNDGVLAGNSAVPYSSLGSQDDLTQAITAAINAPDPAIVATLPGGWVATAAQSASTNEIRLNNATTTSIDPPAGDRLLVLDNQFAALVGDQAYDGATFVVTDLDGDTITFEFEDINLTDGVVTGNSVVLIDPNDTQNALTQAVANAINAPDPGVLAGLAGTWDATAIQPAGTEDIRIAGAQAAVLAPQGGAQLLSFTHDFRTLNPGNSFDGSTFSIRDTSGDIIVFEFEDANNPNGVAPGHQRVSYDPLGTNAEFLNVVTTAINLPDPAILASIGNDWDASALVPAGTEEIYLTGATTITTNPTDVGGATTLANNVTSLNAGESFDGATFTVTDASGDTITFEFNDTTNTAPATPGVAAGNSAIDYTPSDTREQLSQKISDAINNPDPAVVGALAGAWEAISFLPAGGNQLRLSGITSAAVTLSPPIVNPLTVVQQFNPLMTQAIVNPLAESDAILNPLVTGMIVNPFSNSDTIVNPIFDSLEAPTQPLAIARTLVHAADRNEPVFIEEFFTNEADIQFAPEPSTPGAIDELERAINAANIGIAANAVNSRLELPGATAADFSNIPPVAFTNPQGNVNSIVFDFGDSANQLTTRLLTAIQTVEPLAQIVEGGSRIWLPARSSFIQGATDDRGDTPSRNAQLSSPQYGYVTGLAFAGSEMFAVSENGDLFQVGFGAFAPNSTFNNGDYIETIYNPNTGNRVNFVSVTSGPRNAESNVQFAENAADNGLDDILFGIDQGGVLYAFDTLGRPAHVFPNAQWFIQTQATNPSGLAFSNLDVNLWHVTQNNRNQDDGHGVNVSFDGSRRTQQDGGNSLYFGFENPNDPQVQVGDWSGVNNPIGNFPGYDAAREDTYDFTGGASGSVVSDTLNLTGYGPGDKPFLYFNYYLATEGSNANNPTDNNFMNDAFRVFVSGNDGQWQLMATNNSDYDAQRAVGQRDELDYPFEVDPFNALSRQVTELFDVGQNGAPDSWRQARVDLSRFAGERNVRIRFDFSSTGSMDVGATGGVELVAVAGDQIREGQRFVIGNTTYEFDLGLVLQMPSGARLTNGQTFEVDGVTYTFATDNIGNNVQFSASDSPDTIAARLVAKLQARGLNATIDPSVPSRISVMDAVDPNPFVAPSLPATFVSDRPGTAGGAVGVLVNNAMTMQQVRDSIRASIARSMNVPGQENDISSVRFHQSSIFLWNTTVTNINSPLGFSNGLQGDEYGERNSGPTNQVGLGALRGQNNRFEGVYLDDIIVGFAERGEMVTYEDNSTVADTTFVLNPQHEPAPGYIEVETGTYQIEIRRGATYGIGGEAFPEFFPFAQFDTNHRHVQEVSLIAPSGAEVADGQTFQLSDGVDTVTFEYDDLTITAGPNFGVAQGNIRVPFSPQDSGEQLAIRIRDAINSPQTQAVLDVVAGMSDGTATGVSNIGKPTTSRVVNLHGSVSTDNSGGADFDGTSQNTASGANTGGFILYGVDFFRPTELGDSNRERDQGQILIHSNIVRDSSNYGIVVDAGARVSPLIPLAGALPHPGSVRNLVQFNETELIPGPVLINNLVYANAVGGILFSGDNRSANTPEAPRPFGRIVNNTVVGTGAGNGINVTDFAAPTLLNNIVSSFTTGIRVDGTSNASTVIGATSYHNNGGNTTGIGLGTDPQLIGPSEPLFVNAAGRNYYLADGSRVIDSSVDSLNDRQEMTTVRDPLGIAVSPILAPNLDLTGQLRVDDPDISNPNGTGGNPFKDRGAYDRADFFGPLAELQQPIDNDPDNIDSDRTNTFIQIEPGAIEALDFFSILLFEEQGTGPDAGTVTADAVLLTENGRVLQSGVDYTFGYNPGSRLIRLTPLAGIWRNDSVYEITLNNQNGIRIASPDGAGIVDGDTFDIVAGGNTLTFEFDNDGQVTDGAIGIAFDPAMNRYQISTLLAQAINNAGSGLGAYVQGDRAVMVTGAASVSSLATTNVGAIRDIAGHALQANRVNSLTQFTIIMPEVELDYGDAPAAGHRTVMTDGTGARTIDASRHAILPIDAPKLVLGTYVDGELDGQPSISGAGDDAATAAVSSTNASVTVAIAGGAVFSVQPASPATDGQRITITDPTLQVATFEFDTAPDPGLVTPGAIRIPVSIGEAADSVAAKLRNAVNQAVLDGHIEGLNAFVNNNVVDLGGSSQHVFDLSAAGLVVTRLGQSDFDVTLPGDVADYSDGDVVSITDTAGRTIQFELDDSSAPSAGLVATDNVAFVVDLSTATAEEIAVALTDAINTEIDARRLSLAPVELAGLTFSISGDDEDGVHFGGLFNANSQPVDVTITATGNGILTTWFDWNGDGDFADPGERIAAASDLPISEGQTTITIATPAIAQTTAEAFQTANPGERFFVASRFRLSTNGTPRLGEAGIGGEVEDYMVEIVVGAPPVAIDDTYEVLEDTVLTVPAIGVLGNDTDPDHAVTELEVVDEDPSTPELDVVKDVENGTLVLNQDGSFVYTPDPDFFGQDTFTYNITDPRLLSQVPATVTITVHEVNDDPTAIDDTITIFEDESITRDGGVFTANDLKGVAGTRSQTNELGQDLIVIDAVILHPDPGTVGGSVSVVANEVIYTPPANYNNEIDGPVQIELTIQDNGQTYNLTTGMLEDDFKTSISTLTVNVTALNDSPVFTMLSQDTVDEDAGPQTVDPFIENIGPGPDTATDEGTGPAINAEDQQVSFTVTALEPTLFASGPTIDANGVLQYELNPDVTTNAPFPSEILVEVTAVDTGSGESILRNLFDASLVAAGAGGSYDGATFTLTDIEGNVVVFEFEDVRLPGVGDTGGVPHVAIAYDPAVDTQASISQAIADAISNPPPASIATGGAGEWSAAAFVDAVSGEIRLQGDAAFAASPAVDRLRLTNQFPALNAGESYDGATFTLTDSDSDSLTFEFNDITDTSPATPGVVAGNVAIDYDPAFTANQLSQAISDAINNPPAAILAGLTGTWTGQSLLPAGSDELQLSGIATAQIDPSAAPVINPLVAESLGGLAAPVESRTANNSVTSTFTIVPTAINDAPEFDLTADTVDTTEDQGLVTFTDIVINALPGPTTALDELASQNLTLTVVANDPTAFSVQPDVTFDEAAGTATLTFATAADVNNLTGNDLTIQFILMDDGGVVHPMDQDTTIKTLTVSVAPINDAPSFNLPVTDITVFEDHEEVTGTDPNPTVFVGFAENPTQGPVTAVDETELPGTVQTLDFRTISVSDPTLFEIQPTITPAGDLTFKTAQDRNGVAIVIVRLLDDGVGPETGNGDDNQARPDQTFTINIAAVNDPPEFAVPATTNSREDQGLVQVPGFATNLRAGPATATDESGQEFTVHVQAVDPSAFAIQPAIAADGTLTYQLAADVNSVNNANLQVEVFLTDDGTAGPAPDNNQSQTETFTIIADPINDAPQFTLAQSSVSVIEDTEDFFGTAFTTVPGVAANIAAGPSTATDEGTQQLTFEVVSVSAPELFDTLPAIDSATGDLTFTTAQHKNGTAFVVVRLTDDGVGSPAPNTNRSELQTLTISVTPVNDAPEFNLSTPIVVNEDAGLISRNGFATDVRRGPVGADDENNQLLTFEVVAVDPSSFAVQPAIGPDGTLTFQTAPNVNSASGADLSVEVRLVDNGAASPVPNENASAVQVFTIQVTPVNDDPIPDAFNTNIVEDNAVVIQAVDVLAGDSPGPTSDESTQSLTMVQIERTSSAGGIIEPVFNGDEIVSFTYTPPTDLVGTDTFLYVVSDDGVPPRSGTGTITISIAGINDAPQFVKGQDQTVPEDSDLVTVANWASDILAGPPAATDEHASQTVSFIVSADNQAIFEVQPAVSSDGTLTYKPAANANGTAVVTVRAIDDGASDAPNVNTSEVQTFTISIAAVNDAPVFTAGGNVTVAEDSGPYSAAWATGIAPAAGLLDSPQTATDEASQVVDFIADVDQPGLFSVQPTISSTGQLEFTPEQDAFGSAVVVVTAVDRGPAGGLNVNTSAAQTFTITLTPVNDRPDAVGDSYSSDENQVLALGSPGLLANDTDVDLPADSLAAVAETTTSALGAVVVIGQDGSFSYDPSSVTAIQQLTTGQSVLDSFVYRIEDAAGTVSDPATVTVNVSGIDDAPIAVDDAFSMGVGQTRLLEVLVNDSDIDSTIDPRTITITTVPIFGDATPNQTGVIEYTAGAGFRGVDTLGYTVRDAAGNVSNEAFVTITVNNAPNAANDSTFTFKNESVDINVLANDSDLDGTIDPESVQVVVTPTPSGTAEVLPGGVVRFTPGVDFAGQASFSYVVNDDLGTPSNVADVLIRVQNSRWQNPQGSFDVNDDGFVSPIDPLIIINYLNNGGEQFLPNSGIVPAPYLDPSGDEVASPLDALLIINFLNNNSGGGGEGEADLTTEGYVMTVTPEQVIETVGPQIVREIQSAMDDSLIALSDDESLSVPFPGLEDRRRSEVIADQLSDEELIHSLSCDHDEVRGGDVEEAVDSFFSEMGPHRRI